MSVVTVVANKVKQGPTWVSDAGMLKLIDAPPPRESKSREEEHSDERRYTDWAPNEVLSKLVDAGCIIATQSPCGLAERAPHKGIVSPVCWTLVNKTKQREMMLQTQAAMENGHQASAATSVMPARPPPPQSYEPISVDQPPPAYHALEKM